MFGGVVVMPVFWMPWLDSLLQLLTQSSCHKHGGHEFCSCSLLPVGSWCRGVYVDGNSLSQLNKREEKLFFLHPQIFVVQHCFTYSIQFHSFLIFNTYFLALSVHNGCPKISRFHYNTLLLIQKWKILKIQPVPWDDLHFKNIYL